MAHCGNHHLNSQVSFTKSDAIHKISAHAHRHYSYDLNQDANFAFLSDGAAQLADMLYYCRV